MTTSEEINSALPFAGGNTVPLTLLAVQAAARAAWPAIKVEQYATLATAIDDQVFVYSLATLTDLPRWGLGRVFISPEVSTDEPEYHIRDVSQYNDNGTWFLKFPPYVVSQYDTHSINVRYWAAPTVPTTSGETLHTALPYAYVENYVLYWYARRVLSQQSADQAANRELLETSEREWREELRKATVMDTLGVLANVPARDIL